MHLPRAAWEVANEDSASTEKQTPGWAPSQLCCSPASESKHKHFLRNILLQHEELKCEDSRIIFFLKFEFIPPVHVHSDAFLPVPLAFSLCIPHVSVVAAHAF